jgi:hypothetical protein
MLARNGEAVISLRSPGLVVLIPEPHHPIAPQMVAFRELMV